MAVVVPEVVNIQGYSQSEKELLEILNRNTKSLSGTLTKRLDSVFQSHLGCLTSYKVSNLIQFYNQTLLKTLGDHSELYKTMKELSNNSSIMFLDSLDRHRSELVQFIPQAPMNLEPTQAMRDNLSQLKEILVSYDMSMLSYDRNGDKLVEPIFVAFLDSLFTIVEGGARALSALDGAIYKVNCFNYAQVCSIN
jgi:hypothetical protein